MLGEQSHSILRLITFTHMLLTGTLAITSMSSSRVFMDSDVQPSKDYLEWYGFVYAVIIIHLLMSLSVQLTI